MALTKVTGSGADGLNLSSTDVTISSGDLLFATANKGVVLGVTSNTDGNTLDDYEEGTWTVTPYDDSGNSSSTTYTGYYTKIGNLVSVNVYMVNISSAGLTSGESVTVNLPFTVKSSTYSVGGVISDNVDFSSGRTQINARANSNDPSIIFRGSGDATGDDAITWGEITNTVSDIFFSVTYLT